MITTDISLFFDPTVHKYTDNRGNEYVSVTTLIGKYEDKFDSKKMARLCELSGRKGNPKYRGKTAKQLEKEWKITSKEACDLGNEKHNYLEESIKASTGFRTGAASIIASGRILTINDVITNPGFGELSLEYFVTTKIDILYPSIYAIVAALVKQGYRIYAELGVFNYEKLISGLIDLFLIKDKEFIIIDWKTNRADINYKAGYYEKDGNGNFTGNFIETYKTFKEPLDNIPCSVGYKYTFQLSSYAFMAERFGLTCKAIILCHIRHEMYLNTDVNAIVNKVDFRPITYMKNEVEKLMNHHYDNRKLNKQLEITVG